ncbi:MAG: SemiSWEET family transporter [Candidatus Pacebacteria bacterium]|nr:SemiSWEET family transporter [Candidatus Paceibacterota bacterium]
MIEIVGIAVSITGIGMSLAYYPQVWKIYKNKSADDISVPSYLMFFFGTSIWTLYGFLIRDTKIIAGFALGVIGSFLILVLTFYYRRKPDIS